MEISKHTLEDIASNILIEIEQSEGYYLAREEIIKRVLKIRISLGERNNEMMKTKISAALVYACDELQTIEMCEINGEEVYKLKVGDAPPSRDPQPMPDNPIKYNEWWLR